MAQALQGNDRQNSLIDGSSGVMSKTCFALGARMTPVEGREAWRAASRLGQASHRRHAKKEARPNTSLHVPKMFARATTWEPLCWRAFGTTLDANLRFFV